jgi:hypothetical protein
MRRQSKIIIVICVVLALFGAGFLIWAETPLGPMKEAFDALNSDSAVMITTGEWLVFQPLNSVKSVGFVIYPGGRVDYRSYAPVAHALAAKGFLVVVVKMPLNLAIFGSNAAQKVIDSYPGIQAWAIGGHSLGGTFAAQYVLDSPKSVKGLVLWASYPASGNDLSKLDISVVTIRGTRDGLVSLVQIYNSLKMLPPNTIHIEIEGGNHAQFGWYGQQPGDNGALISGEVQTQEIVEATLQLLEKLK